VHMHGELEAGGACLQTAEEVMSWVMGHGEVVV
jgi:hypothetical protein